MPASFTWIPLYEELATTLLAWRERQPELIAFLESLREQDLTITPLLDKDAQGARFPIEEIDPFTFLGVVNRGIRDEHRLAILAAMKRHFELRAELPSDFDGVPFLNNRSSWLIRFKAVRDPGDVGRLWDVFELAQRPDPLQDEDFLAALDRALAQPRVHINLTMGLFWIRPRTFLSLDQHVRNSLGIRLPPGGLTASFYRDTVLTALTSDAFAPSLSHEAYATEQPAKPTTPTDNDDVGHWLVGAYWDDHDPSDQTKRFIENGIWENGYDDRYLDEVKSIRVGDRIGIKAVSTQKLNLPFEAHGKTISRLTVKTIGTVVRNLGDGRQLEVEWEPEFEPRDWFFFTYQRTVWRLRTDPDYQLREYAQRLIDFAWHGAEQDYAWFLERWDSDEVEPAREIEIDAADPYGVDDLLTDGVFLDAEEIEAILRRIATKKAVILQGPPGVGKTFVARRLAFALMEERDPERLRMVQFHQSYAYEDFVRGYRPLPDQAGAFGLRDGVFFRFCQQARNDPERAYVFIIDEINRGNLSQIFGEILMLIEPDKRGPEYAMPLVYHRDDEPDFFVPTNVHLIGLMNVADRSLAMMDYALRRRFAFIDLEPRFQHTTFQTWLRDRNMPDDLITLIVDRMTVLNGTIASDKLLGRNFRVGHSYFCPRGDDFVDLGRDWYDVVIDTEIGPLLREYWYDDLDKAESVIRSLRSS